MGRSFLSETGHQNRLAMQLPISQFVTVSFSSLLLGSRTVTLPSAAFHNPHLNHAPYSQQPEDCSIQVVVLVQILQMAYCIFTS